MLDVFEYTEVSDGDAGLGVRVWRVESCGLVLGYITRRGYGWYIPRATPLGRRLETGTLHQHEAAIRLVDHYTRPSSEGDAVHGVM